MTVAGTRLTDVTSESRTTRADVRRLYGSSRLSHQRIVIGETVLEMPGAFTVEDLHDAVLLRDPGIGLATVYRATRTMLAGRSVSVVGAREGSALLAHCRRDDHHHHLICTACSAVVSIDCPISLTAPDGLLVTHHEIVLYGLCARCQARRGDR